GVYKELEILCGAPKGNNGEKCRVPNRFIDYKTINISTVSIPTAIGAYVTANSLLQSNLNNANERITTLTENLQEHQIQIQHWQGLYEETKRDYDRQEEYYKDLSKRLYDSEFRCQQMENELKTTGLRNTYNLDGTVRTNQRTVERREITLETNGNITISNQKENVKTSTFNSTFNFNGIPVDISNIPSTSSGYMHEEDLLRKTPTDKHDVQSADTIKRENKKPTLEELLYEPKDSDNYKDFDNEDYTEVLDYEKNRTQEMILPRRNVLFWDNLFIHNGQKVKQPVVLTTRELMKECDAKNQHFDWPLIPSNIQYRPVRQYHYVRIYEHNQTQLYFLNNFLTIADGLLYGAIREAIFDTVPKRRYEESALGGAFVSTAMFKSNIEFCVKQMPENVAVSAGAHDLRQQRKFLY
ncbi:unnamed protein product, partial [Allacma fusca]